MKLKVGKYKKAIILECLIISLVLVLIIVSVIKIRKAEQQEIKEPIQLTENNNVLEEPDDLYIVDVTNEIENETEQNEVENNDEKNTNSNENKPKQTNKFKYYIKVNYGAQVVNIYTLDSEGNYTAPVKAMVCSTGTHTPKSGVYSIPGRWSWGLLQGNVYGQYVTKITGNILFHSVPYTQRSTSALEYWEYDKLGTAASLGCVRLKVEDAKWIYDNCSNGTKVEFYSDSNPGPLGKPSAKKISNYPDYLRNWDPTDPNKSNPWHNYKEENIKNEVNEKNNDSKNETTNTTKNEVSNKTENPTQKNEINNKVENTTQKNETNNEVKNITSKNEVNNKSENTTSKNEISNKTENTTLKNETSNKTENTVIKETNNKV